MSRRQLFKNRFKLAAALLLLFGFWVRVSFMQGEIYHIDEFISMLAATMVARRGLPILPSGLFYDHGLLFSMLSGAFVALLGFSEIIARWPTVLISTFTIAAYYAAARRLFDSPMVGLLAAAIATLDELSIVWGARARMYSPAHLFVLLSLTLLLDSTLKQPTERGRYLFLATLLAALLSHTVVFLILAPLGATLLLFSLLYRFEWLRQPRLWRQAIVAAVMLAGTLWIVSKGQTGSTVSLQDPNATAAAPPGLDFLRGFFNPGLAGDRFDDLLDFFAVADYRWLLPLAGLSLLVSLARLLRKRFTFGDIAFLFLALFGALVIFEQGALLTGNWQKSRYLFMIVLPAFFLLGAESIARPLRWAAGLMAKWRPQAGQAWGANLLPLAGVALIAALWGQDAWDTAFAQGAGNYHTAFAYVKEQLQPGDKIMTIHPAAAYLYTGQADYYANQVSAKVIDDDEANALLDRYAGSPLVDSVETFNRVLASGERIWFVVDRSRLYRRYDTLFTQQIFAQMDHVYDTGGVDVFVSRPFPIPLPAQPAHTLNGNFNHLIALQGYTLNPATLAPDGVIPLALYWQPLAESPAAMGQPKVFVQLRNRRGQIVAQADHFLYEGLLTEEAGRNLRQQGHWLRHTADLQLPIPWPKEDGPYQIFVGLYNPDTFERVPLLDDASGENAVVIDFPEL